MSNFCSINRTDFLLPPSVEECPLVVEVGVGLGLTELKKSYRG